jgi:hypothetical protein
MGASTAKMAEKRTSPPGSACGLREFLNYPES